MATPLTIAIPPLRDGQTITAWQPLFMAAVSALEDGAAIKLLPAYLKRGRLEEKIVLSAIQKGSLAEAFNYLKERLDPEEDEFLAAANFRRMTWSPGEAVQDFFATYLEEAVKAKITPRAACAFMVSQAPQRLGQAEGKRPLCGGRSRIRIGVEEAARGEGNTNGSRVSHTADYLNY